MARHIHTEILIQATPQAVWRVLTDFGAYPEWNPFIESLAGVPEPGSRLAMVMCTPDGKRHHLRPVVLQATPPTRLRWLGRVGFPGVFDGEHSFELLPEGAGTRLRHTESFQGVLVPLLWKQVESAAKAGFHAMNSALKARAEGL
jgi:hypothetical protein